MRMAEPSVSLFDKMPVLYSREVIVFVLLGPPREPYLTVFHLLVRNQGEDMRNGVQAPAALVV